MSYENNNGNSPEATRKEVMRVIARHRERALQEKAETGYKEAIDDLEHTFSTHIDSIKTDDPVDFDLAKRQLSEVTDEILLTTNEFVDEGFSAEGNDDIGIYTGTARRSLEDAQTEHDNGDHDQATKALNGARDDAKRALGTLVKEIRAARQA